MPRGRSSPPRSVLSSSPRAGRSGSATQCGARAKRSATRRSPVILPDDLIVPGCLADLVETFHARGAAGVVAVEEVPRRDTARYGVVDTGGATEWSSRIASIVEKPAPEKAPSNLGVVGRYVFDASILGILERTAPGAGGEIQLTDAIARLATAGEVYASRFRGVRHDCGSRAGWLRASVALALDAASSEDPLPHDLESLLQGWRARAGSGR